MKPDFDIRKARTLPAAFYLDPQKFEESKERIFKRSWQWFSHAQEIPDGCRFFPGTLMENFLDTPVVLSLPETGSIKALSNVCTHRAAILCSKSSINSRLICPYHGRQFCSEGKLLHAPGFELADNFPGKDDHLPEFIHALWEGIHFVSQKSYIPFEEWIHPVREKMAFFPLHELRSYPRLNRTYTIEAHWALYCDNYLEGFHIPFVHPGLNKMLEYNQYTEEIFAYGTLQTGIARKNELAFDLPPESSDYGKSVAAYYFFLFPNLMLNFYPWGLSVNQVLPVRPDLSRIEYKTFVWKPELLGSGAGGNLDEVEHEDGAIVEKVQKGIKSGVYSRGRFSPEKEKGVHFFHRRIAECMSSNPNE